MKNSKQNKIREVESHLPNKKNQVIRMDKYTQITMDVSYISLLTDGNLVGKVRVGGKYNKVQYDSKHDNWRLL